LYAKGSEGYGELRDQAFAKTATAHPEWIGPVARGQTGSGYGYSAESNSSCSGSSAIGSNTMRNIERLNTDEAWVDVSASEWTWDTDEVRFISTWSVPSGNQVNQVEYEISDYNSATNTWSPYEHIGLGDSNFNNWPDEGPSVDWGIHRIRAVASVSGNCPGEITSARHTLKVANIKAHSFFGISQGGGASDPAATNYVTNGNPVSHNPGYSQQSFLMGSGDAYYWGRNYPNGAKHDRVGVRVEVRPNVSGIPVHFKLVDADDPTDQPLQVGSQTIGGDIDDETEVMDNVWNDSEYSVHNTVAQSSGSVSLIEKAFIMDEGNPGDNYRIVIAHRGQNDKLDRVRAEIPSGFGNVYYDENNNNMFDDSDEVRMYPFAPETITGNKFRTFELLTIWRTLNIEIDSMAGVANPDVTLFQNALTKSYINVDATPQYWNTASSQLESPNEHNTPFHTQFTTNAAARLYTDGHADLTVGNNYGHEEYWAAHLFGVYRYGDWLSPHDNLPQSEQAYPGYTLRIGNEIHASLIGTEIIRDVASQWSINEGEVRRITALHEVLSHQLRHLGSWGNQLGHMPHPYPGNNILVVPQSDADEAKIPNAEPLLLDESTSQVRRL